MAFVFSNIAAIKDNTIKEFTLYFETDRSFDPNDWFTDQPALLYAVDINLNDNVSEYELQPVGWTPNENTENVISNTPLDQLQNEMRYITHHENNSSFGDLDDRRATIMVNQITAKIK